MKKDLEKFKLLSLYDYDLKHTQQKLYESFIDKKEMNRYSHRMSEMQAMSGDDQIIESSEYNSISELISNQKFDINQIEEFRKSLKSGDRGEFLTDYDDEEYGKMTTYKVTGFNIGFAIKSDGDIVSVHNNTGIKGLGKILVGEAIKLGGTKLDHFDGYLTGLYSSLGFKLVGSDEWNDDYAPMDWKYESVDIFNPATSIYATELKNKENVTFELENKIKLYSQGKPDIIYREL